jgi:hypothetical protein
VSPARVLAGHFRFERSADAASLFYAADLEGDGRFELYRSRTDPIVGFFRPEKMNIHSLSVFRVRGTTPADHWAMPGVK